MGFAVGRLVPRSSKPGGKKGWGRSERAFRQGLKRTFGWRRLPTKRAAGDVPRRDGVAEGLSGATVAMTRELVEADGGGKRHVRRAQQITGPTRKPAVRKSGQSRPNGNVGGITRRKPRRATKLAQPERPHLIRPSRRLGHHSPAAASSASLLAGVRLTLSPHPQALF